MTATEWTHRSDEYAEYWCAVDGAFRLCISRPGDAAHALNCAGAMNAAKRAALEANRYIWAVGNGASVWNSGGWSPTLEAAQQAAAEGVKFFREYLSQ